MVLHFIFYMQAVSAEEDRCFVSGKKLLSTLYEGDYDDININRNLGKDDRRLKVGIEFIFMFHCN